MSKVFLHNTGRRYCKDGQPIRIQADDTGITFTDLARFIKGRIDLPGACESSEAFLVDHTMACYDAGDYCITA